MKKLLTKKYWGTKNHRYGSNDNIFKIIPAWIFFCIVYTIGFYILLRPVYSLISNTSVPLATVVFLVAMLLMQVWVCIRVYYTFDSLFWSRNYNQIYALLTELDKKYPIHRYRENSTIERDGEWYCVKVNHKKE